MYLATFSREGFQQKRDFTDPHLWLNVNIILCNLSLEHMKLHAVGTLLPLSYHLILLALARKWIVKALGESEIGAYG